MAHSEAIALIAVDAMAEALEPHTAITLRNTSGATPLGRMPPMTWGDVFRYQEACLDLLMNAALHDDRAAVSTTATRRLPRAIMNLISRGQTERSLPHLRTIVDSVVGETNRFSVSELADAMMWGRRAIRGDAQGPDDPAARATLDALTQMIDRLRGTSFAVRLKLWIGGWILDPENTPAPRAASDEAIVSLAREAHDNPALLSEDLIGWLSSSAAQSGKFWFELGRMDADSRFQDRVRAFAGLDTGVHAFITYVLGWCARDQQAGRHFFAEVAGAETTTPRALLFGALEIDAPHQGADRIADLLQTGRIDGEQMFNPLSSARWLREATEQDLARVLRLVAGPDFSRGSQIPHFLFLRFHDQPLTAGPLADLGWEYLEAHVPANVHLADFYSDELAARLARLDVDRAFALLRTAILDEREGHRWNPLASQPQLAFWNALSASDRARALATLLDAAATQRNVRYAIMWHLPNLIDLEADAELLGAYVEQGESQALAVVQALIGGRPGFWPLAFRLIGSHPESIDLRHDLESRVEQMGQMIRGPYSEHYQRCLTDVEEALRLPGATETARHWLIDFADRLRRAVDEQRRREADERINRG